MKATKNITKIQLLNMKAGSISMKDNIGMPPIKVEAAAVMEDIDQETGEERLYNYIIGDDANVYGGNSAVVAKIMDDLIDLIDDGETVYCTFATIPTKGGREAVRLVLS